MECFPKYSLNEFSVSTQVLRNQSLSTRIYHNDDFKVFDEHLLNRIILSIFLPFLTLQLYGHYEKGFQSNIHVIDDSTGVVFLNLFQQYGVGCFNINGDSGGKIRTNVVQRKRNEMVYPSHLSVKEKYVAV